MISSHKINSISDQVTQSITSFLIVFLAHIKLSNEDFVFIGILTTFQFGLSGVLRSLIIERAFVLKEEFFNLETVLRKVTRPFLYFYFALILLGIYLYYYDSSTATNICFGIIGVCSCIMFEMRRSLKYIINHNTSYYLEYIPIAIFPPVLVAILANSNLLQYISIIYGPYFLIEILHSSKKLGIHSKSEFIHIRKFLRNGSSLGFATVINLISNILFIQISLMSGILLYTDLRLAQNFCSPLGVLQKVRNFRVFEKRISKKYAKMPPKKNNLIILKMFFAISSSVILLKIFLISHPIFHESNLYAVYLIIFTEVLAITLAKHSTLIRLDYPKIVLLNSMSTLFLTLTVLTIQSITSMVFIVQYLFLKVIIYLFLNNEIILKKLQKSVDERS